MLRTGGILTIHPYPACSSVVQVPQLAERECFVQVLNRFFLLQRKEKGCADREVIGGIETTGGVGDGFGFESLAGVAMQDPVDSPAVFDPAESVQRSFGAADFIRGFPSIVERSREQVVYLAIRGGIEVGGKEERQIWRQHGDGLQQHQGGLTAGFACVAAVGQMGIEHEDVGTCGGMQPAPGDHARPGDVPIAGAWDGRRFREPGFAVIDEGKTAPVEEYLVVLVALVSETAAAEAVEFRNSVEQKRGLLGKYLLRAQQGRLVQANGFSQQFPAMLPGLRAVVAVHLANVECHDTEWLGRGHCDSPVGRR